MATVLQSADHGYCRHRRGATSGVKELRLATFNPRVETVTTKPFFREPFKKKRCLT
jgi:putative SOS response-associated peptidase YedK